ncbi:MAG: hypothetical protein MUC50_07450 [Myxococcota bacterium]|jgi:hypothetical protein|nr:hypothetical protein [Myxococcota bacterium]
MRPFFLGFSLSLCLASTGCERRVDLGFDPQRPLPSDSETATHSGIDTSTHLDLTSTSQQTGTASDTDSGGSAH